MPFQVKSLAQLEAEYRITKVVGLPEIDEENPILVSFRQATNAEDIKRDEYVSVPITRRYASGDDLPSEQFQLKPVALRQAYEVYLTMASCDIIDEDNTPLFKFSEVNGARKVAGDFSTFQKKWGRLPSSVCDAIYLKCLDSNPEWGFNFGDDDEGED